MLNIGVFAQIGGVSVRMLRHYDDLGLLRPAAVDQWTGRRRYEVDQLAVLNRIVTLKELGFTLQQVGELLRDGVSAAELRGMLRLRRSQLEWQAYDIRHRVAQIDARLRLIESDHTMHEVVVKTVEPMRVAALSDQTEPDDTFASFVEDLFIRAGDLMDAAKLSRTTPVSWYIPEPSISEEALRIYAGFAVTGQAPPGLQIVEMPAAEVASVIHRGPMETVGHAHQTLARWAESHGDETAGHTRRKRTVFLEANGANQADWVVEVQLELA